MGKLHCYGISKTTILERQLNNKNKSENTKQYVHCGMIIYGL